MTASVVLISVELESDDPTLLERETKYAKENAGKIIAAFRSKAQVAIYTAEGILERSNQVNNFPRQPEPEMP